MTMHGVRLSMGGHVPHDLEVLSAEGHTFGSTVKKGPHNLEALSTKGLSTELQYGALRQAVLPYGSDAFPF